VESLKQNARSYRADAVMASAAILMRSRAREYRSFMISAIVTSVLLQHL